MMSTASRLGDEKKGDEKSKRTGSRNGAAG